MICCNKCMIFYWWQTMKKMKIGIIMVVTAILLTACGTKDAASQPKPKNGTEQENPTNELESQNETEQKNQIDELEPQKKEVENTEENETKALFGSFSTIDLEENTITEDIFSEYEITMVNIWATTCPPCIKEMPELGAIQEEYKEKGVQVIGIVVDTLDRNGDISESQVSTAKDIVEATGANYTHLLPSMELYFSKLKDVSAVPETVFLDKEGVQIGKSYLGAKTGEDWKTIIDGLLQEIEGKKE